MKHTVTGQSNTRHRTPAATRVPSRSSTPAFVAFIDNRPEVIAQRKLADAIHHSPSMVAQRQQFRRMFGEAAQLKEPEEELQMKAGSPSAPQRQRKNHTGLPDNLKSGVESLSGMSMDNVRVHYHSSQPAQLNALAYAQGTDIHVVPGQEQHLPHEAWHVVQQAQGRVQPTMQMKDGVPVNDDKGLEHEADVMGSKAAGRGTVLMHAPTSQDHGVPEGPSSQVESRHGRVDNGSVNVLSLQLNRLSLQRSIGHPPVVSSTIQRQFNDEDKTGEGINGLNRGPAEKAETATPTAESVNAFGEMDGEISSSVHPHAFINLGRTGQSLWHHCGGQGGVGNEAVGEAQLVAPVYVTKPAKPGGQAKAWIQEGTGKVTVSRSFTGVPVGPQGAYLQPPDGTVWMSKGGQARVDTHEREHLKKAKELHDTHLKPLESRIAKYRGLLHSIAKGADENTAQAALQGIIDWNGAINAFKNADAAENSPMGLVDQADMNTADFYRDYDATPYTGLSGCTIYVDVPPGPAGKLAKG